MPSKPRIALVHDWLTVYAGADETLLELHKLFPDAPIYTSLWDKERCPQFKDATVITSYLQSLPGATKRHQLLIPLMPQAFESFDLKDYDIIISSTTGTAKGVITQPGQTHISYCHTPPRYLWNLANDTRSQSSWLRAYVSHKMRVWDVVSAQRVDQFVANSHTVEKRINKIYRKEALVIYPPVRTDKYAPTDEKPGDYFLCVGRHVSYKRVDLAIEACKITKQPLKIVGSGPETPALMKLAEGCPWIEFMGYVSDAQLRELFAKAKAFIFPAEEDFGIVPVEAMSTGRPVIAFGKGGATESVKDKVTGTFFAEQTPASLAETLSAFDPNDYDPKAVRAHALTFDASVFRESFKKLVESYS